MPNPEGSGFAVFCSLLDGEERLCGQARAKERRNAGVRAEGSAEGRAEGSAEGSAEVWECTSGGEKEAERAGAEEIL